MNSTEEFYRSEIKKAIKREISMGNDDLANIITSLGGADPRIVIEIYNEVIDNGIDIPNSEEFDRDIQATRSFIAHALFDFPAPDPMRSQWWFSLDTIEELAIRIYKLCDSKDASFLGSPTVGLFYSHCFKTPAVLLDIDSDILTSVTALTNVDVYQYDVADELPEELINKFQVILIDPPWYPSILEAFLYRANELIEPEGYILCTLPSLFTRPDVTKERLILLGGLLKSNFEVVSIESNLVRYEAPEFEIAAYKDISELINHKWRCGDLLILRTTQNSNLSFPTRIPKLHVESYARDPQKTRFFLCTDRIVDEQKETIKVIDSFESNVSVRAIPIDQVTVWGTNKKGVSLNDITIGQAILNAWKQGKNPEETTEELVKLGYKNPDTNVQDFNKYLELWEDFDKTALRRGPKELENKRNEYVSEFASKPSSRMYEFTPDGFRVDFQRDRDRVLWSHSLKRLANKTQLFPVQKGDQLRRRLVHSIEVMQLASTISSSFGLDRDLTEACALAHDIGHLPFGHGGEYALNSALNEISEAFGGFNHYEHGVDVVRWLENVYQQPGAGGFPGLNLTFETVEGIFKHCYHMGGDHELGQRTLSRKTKHQIYERIHSAI
jgi:dGTPase